ILSAVPSATHAQRPAGMSPPVSANSSGVVTIAGVGFSSPENLVYDAQADVYLIANINGGARALDANGFISRVASDGRVLELKWIDGSHAGTRLDGPKGLAIHGDTLVVADVGAVRYFNRRTGASLGVRSVPGQLMNDVAVASDGSVYVTDTGPDAGKPDTADHDAIYRLYHGGRTATIAKSPDLMGPDGVVATDSGIIYATFKGSDVESISTSGKRRVVARLPGNQVDGLRQLPDRSYIVTSWGARTVYRMQANGTLHPVLTGVTSPAGVAYDTRNAMLAITSMQDNKLYLLSLR
ncbi:MAG TPA: SMP-30/gluconolactonase/LRE family protein, partial [Gemmatimonadaceae bacterium]